MTRSYCNLAVHSLFPNWAYYSQAAVYADCIDTLFANEPHYLWSHSPPDELAMLTLPPHLLTDKTLPPHLLTDNTRAPVLGSH